MIDHAQAARLVEAAGHGRALSVAIADEHGSIVAGAVHEGGERVHAPVVVAGQVTGHVAVTAVTGEHSLRAAAEALAHGLAQCLTETGEAQGDLDAMAAELLERYEELNLLYDLAAALTSVLEVPRLCDIALAKAVQAVAAERALVAVSDPQDETLSVVAAHGLEGLVGRGLPPDDAVTARVAASGRRSLLLAGEDGPGQVALGRDRRDAVLSVPVARGGSDGHGHGQALGAITLVGKRSGLRFTAGDAKLASAIATQLAVAIENHRLVSAVREAERVQNEIEIAAGIQRRLLPDRAPDVKGLALAGRCAPAATVGGDYFDFLVDGCGRLWVIIADVAGHSIGSGLLMAMCRSVLRREIVEGRAPHDVLRATNDVLIQDLTDAGLFITVFCARYDPTTRELCFANGAHNPPLLCREESAGVEELDADGMALGMLEDVVYDEGLVALRPGDLVLFYTDGVTEARTEMAGQFGEERLRALLAESGGCAPEQLLDRIEAAVRDHTGDVPQQDDITLVALEAQ